MKDEADAITGSELYLFDDDHFLVSVENIFQATSKEGGRGITTITGHNDQRISVYNLKDGSLIARKKTGRPDRYGNHFLGCTRGNLWFYSFNDGIHTRDPQTLEIKLTQAVILKNNPELEGHLATCEWYQVPQYFQFNGVRKNVVLTDNRGFRYILDPENLKATRLDYGYIPFDPRSDRMLDTHITFPPPSLILTGDLRKRIRIENREINNDLTFLEGMFIVDRNPVRESDGLNKRLSSEMKQTEMVYLPIMRLKSLNGGSGPLWGTPQRDTLKTLENIRIKTESVIRMLEESSVRLSQEGYCHMYKQLLSTDTVSFFVLHAAGTARDANLMISRLKRTGTVKLEEMWTTEIPGLFFDPEAARETNIFKEVFSKGSPDFGYARIDLDGQRLVIIRMLHVCCLDIQTGRILWKIRL